MLIHHPAEDTLHRLVYGEQLPQASAVEAHVRQCTPCAEIVQRFERLRRETASLDRAAAPPPELWQQVRDRTVGANASLRAATSSSERSVLQRVRWPLALAAGVLVTVVSTNRVLRERGTPDMRTPDTRVATPQSASDPGIAVLTLDTAGAGEPTQRLLAHVRASVPQRDVFVSADTEREIMSQLALFTDAVARTQRALDADPNNVQLESMLERARRQHADFVRSTTALFEGF